MEGAAAQPQPERAEGAATAPHVKQHRSYEAAWSYMLHLEEEEANKAKRRREESVGEGSGETGAAQDGLPKDVSRKASDSVIPEDEQLLHLNDGAKLIIGMVGKPARGKTYLATKIRRYCEWLGYKVKHVETVAVRRAMFGKVEPDDFFDPTSVEMTEHRRAAQEKSLQTAIEWLQGGGQVAIYDASNSTRARREWVHSYVEQNLVDRTQHETVVSHRVLWVESFCEDKDRIVQNFLELRRKYPKFVEYKGLTDEQAVAKFMDKLKFFDAEYQALNSEEEDLSYIKLVDFGKRLVVNRVHGFLESKLVSFCMNIHTEPRIIIMVRHGQSEYNLEDRIGGDPSLTPAGEQFAKNLADFVAREAKHGMQGEDNAALAALRAGADPSEPPANPFAFDAARDLYVWTSNLRRTVESVKQVECRARVPWASLAEIDAGVCECMTYKDFKEKLATHSRGHHV